MKKLLLILFILLFAGISYAQDASYRNPDEETGYGQKQGASGGTSENVKGYADQDLYELDEEDPDMYYQGTGEREVNLQDYGVGDTGEDSIEE